MARSKNLFSPTQPFGPGSNAVKEIKIKIQKRILVYSPLRGVLDSAIEKKNAREKLILAYPTLRVRRECANED
jgi:hypothetical protein